MGRNKISMRKIINDKIRKITFKKRKMGLLKKALELSILCGAAIKIKISDEFGGTQEFKTFNKDHDSNTTKLVVSNILDEKILLDEQENHQNSTNRPQESSQKQNEPPIQIIDNNQQINNFQQAPLNQFVNFSNPQYVYWYYYWLYQNGLTKFQ